MATLTDPPDDMPQEVIDFRNRTPMPDTDVDLLWAKKPGYLEAILRGELANIEGRLRKRYATPFNPTPEIVVAWQSRLATPKAYLARGYSPNDQTMEQLLDDRKLALEEIKEAADAEEGLYDLPLKPDEDTTAISKGAPLGYSESSPYDWTDVQADAIRYR